MNKPHEGYFWTAITLALLTTIVVLFVTGTRAGTERLKNYVEHGYTQTVLPGYGYVVWVAPSDTL